MKGAGFVVGLATEIHAHNKAQKAGNQAPKQQAPQRYRDSEGGPPYDEAMTLTRPSLEFQAPMAGDGSTYVDTPLAMWPLPHPVILPQRRPNDKSRGFVRAYAPDLGRYKGIEERGFLKFLKEFHQSSQASGWFSVINIAALGAGFAPGAIAFAVAASVQLASTAAAAAQSRYRTTAFLDKANEDLFHPRNLHCMVLTFKPEARENVVLNLDVNSGSSLEVPTELSRFGSSSSSNASGGAVTGGGRFRKSDGVTTGEFAIPRAAELVYSPATSDDGSLETQEDGLLARPKQSPWKNTAKLLSHYKDRRAQAKFATTYGEDSKLAVPGATDPTRFASKFSDPNGNPLDFLSNRPRDRGEARREWQGDGQNRSRDPRQDSRERSTGLIGGMKNMMKQDLLYLMVAEIPSDEEMRHLKTGRFRGL